jgi:DNA helicase-2/ATP-dependent DNA helicase PcrA
LIRNKEWLHYITTLAGKTGVKPILIVFNPEQIDKIIGEFINVLDAHGLYDNKGI